MISFTGNAAFAIILLTVKRNRDGRIKGVRSVGASETLHLLLKGAVGYGKNGGNRSSGL